MKVGFLDAEVAFLDQQRVTVFVQACQLFADPLDSGLLVDFLTVIRVDEQYPAVKAARGGVVADALFQLVLPLIYGFDLPADPVQWSPEDAFLHPDQFLAAGGQRVERPDHSGQHFFLGHAAPVAGVTLLGPGTAAPDGRAVGLVDVASVAVAAFSADEFSEQSLTGGKPGLLPVQAILLHLHQLALDAHEHLFGHDGRMCIFDVVLGELAIVLPALLGQEVFDVGFLQKQITHEFFVQKHALDRGVLPLISAAGRLDAQILQVFHDLPDAVTLKEIPEDPAHDLRFLRYDGQRLVAAVLGVAHKPAVAEHHFSLLKTVLKTHAHILGNGLRFLLGQAGHYSD